MMIRITHIALLFVVVVLLAACAKDGNDTMENYITFFPYVQNVAGETKSIVPDEDYIIEQALPVVVNDVAVNPVFNNTIINCSANGLWISEVQWDQNVEYTFYGYIASEGNGTDADLTVGNKGYSVNVKQPTAYSHSDEAWSDYLLSYKVTPNSKYMPIVGLQFERITSAIEVYISKAREDKVTLSEISISDVADQMAYTLIDHKLDDRTQSGYRNIWNMNPGSTKVNYVRQNAGELARFVQGDQRYDQKYLAMKILTVPQDIKGRLSLEYKVVENGVENSYSAEYDLSGLPVTKLEIGHKIRYYINIDTSVGVETIVVPWKEVDFVEGTFLPK